MRFPIEFDRNRRIVRASGAGDTRRMNNMAIRSYPPAAAGPYGESSRPFVRTQRAAAGPGVAPTLCEDLTQRDERDDERWHAVVEHDRRADGQFVYGVRSTGIYCRPSCASRRPRR